MAEDCAITSAGVLGRYCRVSVRVVGLTGLSVLSLLLISVASFPGEWLYNIVPPGSRFIPASFSTTGEEWWDKILRGQFQNIHWPDKETLTLREFLVGGGVDDVVRRPKGWWSNRLVVPGIDLREIPKFDSGARIEVRSTTLSLRGRRLEGAVLSGAYLPKADFTGAQLQGAFLMEAHLQGALFDKAQLQGAILTGAQLQGASLEYAQLQGVQLSADYRMLPVGLNLPLRAAQFQGASLYHAELQGAFFPYVQFQGATLEGAQLQGAFFEGAQFQGAILKCAKLQGAYFPGAQFQGATLDGAQLQGATMSRANLQGASLAAVSVWLSNTKGVYAQDARVTQFEDYAIDWYCSLPFKKTEDWSAADYDELVKLVKEKMPSNGRLWGALGFIGILNSYDASKSNLKFWNDLRQSPLAQKEYEKALMPILLKTGCTTKSAPYVISGLLRTLDQRFTADHSKLAELTTAFLKEADCPGARGLSDKDKSALQEIWD